mmetsp:Transcript_46150/g.109249  ORF Transcript_46150/g.109249 Transcript_46150/m.109249 type:complete len:213 (+) Transcript_46150:942-1580(+)
MAPAAQTTAALHLTAIGVDDAAPSTLAHQTRRPSGDQGRSGHGRPLAGRRCPSQRLHRRTSRRSQCRVVPGRVRRRCWSTCAGLADQRRGRSSRGWSILLQLRAAVHVRGPESGQAKALGAHALAGRHHQVGEERREAARSERDHRAGHASQPRERWEPTAHYDCGAFFQQLHRQQRRVEAVPRLVRARKPCEEFDRALRGWLQAEVVVSAQ